MRGLLIFLCLIQVSTAFAGDGFFSPGKAPIDPALADKLWPARPLLGSDYVYIDGNQFYTTTNGKSRKIKFWGVNMVASANFPQNGDADRVAADLRRLGVNIVRLHQLEIAPDPDDSRANSILITKKYPAFNDQSLARLKYFISACARNGIYVDLNLHVGYTFKPKIDGIPSWDGSDNNFPKYSKPLNIFYPDLVDRQKQYAKGLIDSLSLKGNPALALVEINNESSLYESWLWGELGPSLKGVYKTYLEHNWDESLGGRRGVTDFDDLLNRKAPKDDLILFGQFLGHLDKAFLDGMAGAVKSYTRDNVAISGTQVNYSGPVGLLAQSNMGYVDNHFYFDHYRFIGGAWNSKGWYIGNDNILDNSSGLVDLALERVVSKPYVVSEYNQPWPNTYGNSFPILMAYLGAAQGWGGLIYFDYAQDGTYNRSAPSGFDLSADTARQMAFLVGAYVFRGFDKNDAAICPIASVSDDIVKRSIADANLRDFDKLFNFHISDMSGLNSPVGLSLPTDNSAASKSCAHAADPMIARGADTLEWSSSSHFGHIGQVADTNGYKYGDYAFAASSQARDSFYTFGAIPLDGQPLSYSSQVLLYDIGSSFRATPDGKGGGRVFDLKSTSIASKQFSVFNDGDRGIADLYQFNGYELTNRSPLNVKTPKVVACLSSAANYSASERRQTLPPMSWTGLQAGDGASDSLAWVLDLKSKCP